MKIGILTFHFSDNFGALLQAYALRKWFVDRGHEATFLNYCPAHVEKGGRLRFSLDKDAVKANVKVLYLKMASNLASLLRNKEQARRFHEFRRHHLPVQGPALQAVQDIGEEAVQFDVLVAGSDQIWSPSVQFGFDPAYFLAFPRSPNARRISYAASFGRDTLNREQLGQVGPLISGLSSISVRELSGVDIVRSASGRDAECVPDPTLLHQCYEDLIGQRIGDANQVFCYALRSGDGIRSVATLVSRALDAPVVSPHNTHRRWREIGSTIFPGPVEWISSLASSRFVVTNSFHGAVFAVILKKPFIAVGLPPRKASMNSRVLNLLRHLDLMDRFVPFDEIHRANDLIDRPIDWESVSVKQAALRDAGSGFLERELAGFYTWGC